MPTQIRTGLAEGVEFARAVAAELGPQWSPHPAPWPGLYQLEDGRGGRLVLLRGAVRAVLPETAGPRLHSRPRSPEIGVMPRSAAYVAGHIRRRLLPRYQAARDQQQELFSEQRAEQRERARVAQHLARTLAPSASHTSVLPDTPYRDHTTVTAQQEKGINVRSVVTAAGSEISLKLSGLNPEQAAAIAELVAAMGQLP
ncbi:hypothetical protein AB0F20_29810 [Streptomyces goshikiensis]|uniref:hypothetical protein n=1 Tax=Streptomyces goshikiensis TaxID=1942 RepID=UPI0033F5EAF0